MAFLQVDYAYRCQDLDRPLGIVRCSRHMRQVRRDIFCLEMCFVQTFEGASAKPNISCSASAPSRTKGTTNTSPLNLPARVICQGENMVHHSADGYASYAGLCAEASLRLEASAVPGGNHTVDLQAPSASSYLETPPAVDTYTVQSTAAAQCFPTRWVRNTEEPQCFTGERSISQPCEVHCRHSLATSCLQCTGCCDGSYALVPCCCKVLTDVHHNVKASNNQMSCFQ